MSVAAVRRLSVEMTSSLAVTPGAGTPEEARTPRRSALVAMKLTGHKTEAVYRRYAIAPEQDLREGVAKLAALGAARPVDLVAAGAI